MLILVFRPKKNHAGKDKSDQLENCPKELKKEPMRIRHTACWISLIALASWSTSAQTYSSTALSGLDYQGDPAYDARYVSGTTDVAHLYTADAGLAGDDPAVFAQGPFGNLGNFSATYDLLSARVPAETSPYWIVWVSPPGDSNPGDQIAVIQLSTGSTLNDSSTIHVYDPNDVVGTYFGDALDTLDSTSLGSYTFADMTVDWAGVEIGNWDVSDSISAYANIESLTIGSVSDSTSTLFLSGLGLAGLMVFSYRQNRLQMAK
jgi:hypothetical protein